jgi:carbohydrate-selective porin OprB
MATTTRLRKFEARQLVMACSLLFILVSLLFLSLPAAAQDPAPTPAKTDFLTQKYLLGDWGGYRTKLEEEKGITFDFHYVADFLANPQGGTSGAGAWNRVRGTMDIDFGKLVGANGLTFHVTGLWQGGVNLGGQYLGSLANPSGLVSARTERLDSYWLQQALFHNKLFIRGGQFAGMDFFGIQNYGGDYIIEPLDYAFGNLFNTYESFDPAAGPAAEVRIVPIPQLYIRSAYMSGNRNPYQDDTNGFNFVWKNSGVLLNEVGYQFDQPNMKTTKTKLYPGLYKLGFANNPGRNAFPSPNGYVDYSGNYLVYFMANQAVYRPTAGSNRGVDLHFGFDYSPTDRNKVNQQFTGGFVFNSLIPKRPNDSFAFGIINSSISNVWAAYETALLMTPVGSETAYEVNYSAHLTPYWMVQPVAQFYQSLGGIPANGTGVVLGFRTKVTF